MQIKISFEAVEDIVLPIHYNSTVQGFIYNSIDKELGSFFHDRGYEVNGRSFKLFTFSRILNKGRKTGRYLNFGREIDLVIASPVEEFCRSLIDGIIFKKDLRLRGNRLSVKSIEILDTEVEGSIIVKTLSPIVAYSTIAREDKSKFTRYYGGEDPEFERIIRDNMLKKYKILGGQDLDESIKISLLGKEMTNIVYYKRTVIKGVSGSFLLEGHKDILELSLSTGLGSKNSQGFGLIQKE